MEQKAKGKLEAGSASIVQILDLHATVEADVAVQAADPVHETSAVGIVQLPCHTNKIEKQNHCYNVQKMTKDKASSAA